VFIGIPKFRLAAWLGVGRFLVKPCSLLLAVSAALGITQVAFQFAGFQDGQVVTEQIASAGLGGRPAGNRVPRAQIPRTSQQDRTSSDVDFILTPVPMDDGLAERSRDEFRRVRTAQRQELKASHRNQIHDLSVENAGSRTRFAATFGILAVGFIVIGQTVPRRLTKLVGGRASHRPPDILSQNGQSEVDTADSSEEEEQPSSADPSRRLQEIALDLSGLVVLRIRESQVLECNERAADFFRLSSAKQCRALPLFDLFRRLDLTGAEQESFESFIGYREPREEHVGATEKSCCSVQQIELTNISNKRRIQIELRSEDPRDPEDRILIISDPAWSEATRQQYVGTLRRSHIELDELTYFASHDLRSPLRSVTSLIDLMIDDYSDEMSTRVKEDFDWMRQRVDRMNALLDSLIEYTRIQGNLRPQRWVSIRTVVENAVNRVANPAGLSIKIMGDEREFRTYAEALTRCIECLVENAIQHHDRSTGRVEIDIRLTRDAVRISVRDDGPGIEPAYTERIFRMFQILESRDQREAIGAGLAIVRKTLDIVTGTIRLTHNSPRGSVFTIEWPFEIDEIDKSPILIKDPMPSLQSVAMPIELAELLSAGRKHERPFGDAHRATPL
jgi:signal transduction histidine kinase